MMVNDFCVILFWLLFLIFTITNHCICIKECIKNEIAFRKEFHHENLADDCCTKNVLLVLGVSEYLWVSEYWFAQVNMCHSMREFWLNYMSECSIQPWQVCSQSNPFWLKTIWGTDENAATSLCNRLYNCLNIENVHDVDKTRNKYYKHSVGPW